MSPHGSTDLSMIGRRMLRAILPQGLALRLRQEWIARQVAGGKAHTENEVRLLPQLVGRTSICWDIGANVGMYSVALSRIARKVIAFEPVPHNLQTLRQVIRLSHLDNVDVYDLALSDTTGAARFSVPVNQGFYGGFYMAAFHDQGELEVRTSTIDALIRDGLPAPDFIKCDVEGAETRVINGARHFLSHARPIWLLEALEPTVLPLMQSLGYAAHVRSPENTLSPVSAVRDDCRNYIFLPKA